MADTIQFRRGSKENLPDLSPAEPGLCRDTEELFVGGDNGNIPVLTLESPTGKRLGIDKAANRGSDNLMTSGAVYTAMQGAGGGSFPYTLGTGLKVTGENEDTLEVDSAEDFEGDNSRPASASLVETTVGNIEILLGTI